MKIPHRPPDFSGDFEGLVSALRAPGIAPLRWAAATGGWVLVGERDATYFVLHQLRVVRQAIDDLTIYLERKTHELRDVESRLRDRGDLNHRQIAVLARALRHPDEQWTIQRHMRASGVGLSNRSGGLAWPRTERVLVQRKHGQSYVFMVPADLDRRLGGPR